MGKFRVTIKPNQEFITLQALLQITDIISTGGMAKVFLMDNEVLVNGEIENRRGRKLYPGDEVKVLGKTFVVEES